MLATNEKGIAASESLVDILEMSVMKVRVLLSRNVLALVHNLWRQICPFCLAHV